jgi:two-component system response regulator RegX3
LEAVVLVVADDQPFVDTLAAGLTRDGFRIVVARDGIEAVDRFEAVSPDVVLLDVVLPGMSGLEVCRQIRSHSKVPIVMLSVTPSDVDSVTGLDLGADDFVSKPYRLHELIARLRAVLRRAPSPALGHACAMDVGDLRLDAERHEVLLRGRRLHLPLKEFELLELLMANVGRVILRDTIVNRIWGDDYVGDTRTVDVHVRRLRSKIEDDPSVPQRLITIRGLGYRLEAGPRSV